MEISDLIKILSETRDYNPFELVYDEYFNIEDVLSESFQTKFLTSSEICLGRDPSSYKGGYISQLVLKVKPIENLRVNTLIFKGISIVKSGDFILARIPRYAEEVSIKNALNPYLDEKNPKKKYIPRKDYNFEEEAIEIKILDKDKKILRTERSINYQRFAKV